MCWALELGVQAELCVLVCCGFRIGRQNRSFKQGSGFSWGSAVVLNRPSGGRSRLRSLRVHQVGSLAVAE